MRRSILACSITLGLMVTPIPAADDKPDFEPQKKTAKENCDKVDAGPMVMHQTHHFLILAPKSTEEKLNEWGSLIEKAYDLAVQTLHGPKDSPFKGLLTIYILPDGEM